MGVYSGTEISEEGLVLCLDAANPRSYGGSGTTWYDLTNDEKNITLINSPSFSSNNSGILTFDGIDDYGYTNATDISSDTGLTISIWLYGIKWHLENCPCVNNAGILDWSTGYWNMASINSNLGGPYFTLYADSPSETPSTINRKNISFGATNQLNQWLNLVATYDDTSKEIKTYNNTNLVGNSSIQIDFSISARVHLARYMRHCGNCPSNIIMPQIKIYNRALSAQEITQNFKATRGRFGL